MGGVRRVTLPLSTACKAGASLFSHGPTKLARRLGAAPNRLSFGDSAAQAGARRIKIGAVGKSCAPVAVRKHLLNHNREIERAGSIAAPGPCHFNKEQTPPGDLFDPSPRIHGGCFGVYRHTSSEALKL